MLLKSNKQRQRRHVSYSQKFTFIKLYNGLYKHPQQKFKIQHENIDCESAGKYINFLKVEEGVASQRDHHLIIIIP